MNEIREILYNPVTNKVRIAKEGQADATWISIFSGTVTEAAHLIKMLNPQMTLGEMNQRREKCRESSY